MHVALLTKSVNLLCVIPQPFLFPTSSNRGKYMEINGKYISSITLPVPLLFEFRTPFQFSQIYIHTDLIITTNI